MNTEEIIKKLKIRYPNPKKHISKKNTFQTYITTILSAQCTDEVVEKTTKELFKKYKTIKDFNNLKKDKLELLIKPTGFYKNKAKNIKAGTKLILEKYNGKVPSELPELLKLPGVGKKTANVILQESFNKISGIVVDTHVIRISKRLGLSNSKNPLHIEKDLMEKIQKKYWKELPSLFKSLGRDVCKGKKPNCENCILKKICPKKIN